MPCAGLHGFGYLENIAEVISGVTDHSNNIYPTEQQKARLGHLYPESKTSLVQLDYEEEAQDVPQAVLYSVTGDDMTASQNYDTFSTENGIIKVSTSKTDPAIKINDDKMPTDMNTEDVIAIRVSIKSSVDTHAEIFFTTDQSPNLSQENSFNTTVKKSDDFVDYVFTTEGKAGWIGTISTLRFDIISTSGDFEVSKIEFLGYSEEQLPITITVDNKGPMSLPSTLLLKVTRYMLLPTRTKASSVSTTSTMSGQDLQTSSTFSLRMITKLSSTSAVI